MPDTHRSKNIIPDYKDDGDQDNRREKELPFFIEPDLWMKGINERDNNRKKIDE